MVSREAKWKLKSRSKREPGNRLRAELAMFAGCRGGCFRLLPHYTCTTLPLLANTHTLQVRRIVGMKLNRARSPRLARPWGGAHHQKRRSGRLAEITILDRMRGGRPFTK